MRAGMGGAAGAALVAAVAQMSGDEDGGEDEGDEGDEQEGGAQRSRGASGGIMAASAEQGGNSELEMSALEGVRRAGKHVVCAWSRLWAWHGASHPCMPLLILRLGRDVP